MWAIPSYLDVVCSTDWCPVGGRATRVYLRLVALDVVEWPDLRCVRCGCQMARKDPGVALWRCDDCTTPYAVGLERCPHCGSTDAHEEGSMAKITRHGGASDINTDPPVAVPASAEPAPVAAAPAEAELVPVEDVPAEQTEAAPEETDQAAEVPAEPPAPKPARGRGRPRKAA